MLKEFPQAKGKCVLILCVDFFLNNSQWVFLCGFVLRIATKLLWLQALDF